MSNQLKTKDYLEDEEINEIVSKILPHLQGLNYSQASRVLHETLGQASRIAFLDANSIQQASAEHQPASSGQA